LLPLLLKTLLISQEAIISASLSPISNLSSKLSRFSFLSSFHPLFHSTKCHIIVF
jgi:hypothetical protein